MNTPFHTLSLCFSLGMIALCILTGHAQADDMVVHYHERPPYYVTDANGLGGIIGERVRAVFTEARIPFTVHITPAKRQLVVLRDNTGIDCMVGWFLTPRREAFAQYSRAIYQDRPMVVLTREDNHVFDKPMSLGDLLTEPGITLLVKDGYSYGMVIDAMIAQSRPSTEGTTAESGNMVKMIHAGRADYLFIGAQEAELIIRQTGLPRNDFRILYPSGMPPFNKRYLLFSKKTDPALIERINRAIDKLYPLGD